MSAFDEIMKRDVALEAQQVRTLQAKAMARLSAALRVERRTSHLPPGCKERDLAVGELRCARIWAEEMEV